MYKGLRETEVRPGEWVAISGIGGLGHMAVRYAKAMGMHVAAIDLHPEKLELAKARRRDRPQRAGCGRRGRVAEADPGRAWRACDGRVTEGIRQAFGMLRSRGTMALVGLPPGTFALPIFNMVLKRITVRGSIVGTRQDLEEALDFAGTAP